VIHIHIYEKWADVATFQFAYNTYLLQGRKCKWCRRTSFRVARPFMLVADCAAIDEGALKRAGLWEGSTPQEGGAT